MKKILTLFLIPFFAFATLTPGGGGGGGGSGDALVANPLSQFASTTSLQLKGVLSDETGSGAACFATSPTFVTPLLGTPTSGTLTNATGLPIATGVSGLASGAATFLATSTSANLATLLTNETGSGAAVFGTSPTLVTPALGTPSALVLTSATGLPLTTGVTGVLPIANMATGTPDGTKFIRDDGTLVTPSGGGGSPAGADTQVQYNNASSFGGAPLYVGATRHLQVDHGTGTNGYLQWLQGSTTGSATTDGFKMGWVSGGTNQFDIAYLESSTVRFKYGSIAYLQTGGSDVSLNDPGNTGNTLTVSNKGVKIDTSVVSRPTCDSDARSFFWQKQSAGGTADYLEVCNKDQADAYAWRNVGPRWVTVKDVKTVGTSCGNNAAGSNTFQTRTLNTIDDHGTGATLASNKVNLPAGTWHAHFDSPGFNTGKHKAILYNDTASATVPGCGGSTEYAEIGANTQTRSVGDCIFTITAAKDLYIGHFYVTGSVSNGLGVGDSDFGPDEVCAQITFQKL